MDKERYIREYRFKRLKFDENIQLIPPPTSSEEKTLIELNLIEIIGQRIKKEDFADIEKYKGRVLESYIDVLNSFSLNYDKVEIEEIIEDIKILVMREKIKHLRPRPNILGNRLEYNINELFYKSEESNTPSYPCSDATESMFLSLYLADTFPLYKNVFMEMANKISNINLISSLHYPTDNLAGQTLAHVLYNNYKKAF